MQKPNTEKPASSETVGKDDAEKNILSKAINLVRQGKMREARRLLQAVLEEDRDNEMAWIWLASTYPSDAERLRLLQYYLDRHPESDLVSKSVLAIRDRISRRANRVIEEAASAESLSHPIPAGQLAEEIQGVNATASPAGITGEMNKNSAPPATTAFEQLPVPLPEGEKEEDTRESTLLLIAIAVIAVTVISALLWTILT